VDDPHPRVGPGQGVPPARVRRRWPAITNRRPVHTAPRTTAGEDPGRRQPRAGRRPGRPNPRGPCRPSPAHGRRIRSPFVFLPPRTPHGGRLSAFTGSHTYTGYGAYGPGSQAPRRELNPFGPQPGPGGRTWGDLPHRAPRRPTAGSGAAIARPRPPPKPRSRRDPECLRKTPLFSHRRVFACDEPIDHAPGRRPLMEEQFLFAARAGCDDWPPGSNPARIDSRAVERHRPPAAPVQRKRANGSRRRPPAPADDEVRRRGPGRSRYWRDTQPPEVKGTRGLPNRGASAPGQPLRRGFRKRHEHRLGRQGIGLRKARSATSRHG